MTKSIETKLTRQINIIRNFTKYAPGSVLVSFGDTRVLCTATIENSVPRFLKGQGVGWLTAEYSMLPGSTHERVNREVQKGKPSGRTSEIQRLIGQSLRAVIDFEALGERTIFIDADVIQADGGTRTAAITGGMAALIDAVNILIKNGELTKSPIKERVAAVSVGIVDGEYVSDLCYEEDSNAELDMNIVMTESGKLVEVQGTAEKDPFSKQQLNDLVDLAEHAILHILDKVS